MLGNAVSITQSRFSLVYKTMLYTLIVVFVLSALMVGVLSPLLSPFFNDMREVEFWADSRELIVSVISGADSEVIAQNYEQFQANITRIGEIIGDHMSRFWWSAALIIVFIFLIIFATSLAHFPQSDVLFNFMNSNSKFGFTANLFSNMRQSLRYAGFNVAATVINSFLLVGVMLFSFFVVGMLSVFLVLPFYVIVSVFLFAVKNSFLQRWLPAMVVGKKRAWDALKESLVYGKRNFKTLLGLYFAVHLLLFAFHLMITLFTFGIGLLFTLAVERVLLRSLELVNYHKSEGMKFYTQPVEFRREEKADDEE